MKSESILGQQQSQNQETPLPTTTQLISRRPRGRPPGSKNKPKPPIIITREIPSPYPYPYPPSMSPYVFELPPNIDILAATSNFCRRNQTSLCILSGNGVVSDITIKQSSTNSTVTFHGRFDILSISSTILYEGNGDPVFTVAVGGPHGNMVGGVVVGKLVAVSTVYLVGASFGNPEFVRLVDEENCSNGNGGNNNDECRDVGDQRLMHGNKVADVLWAPVARQAREPAAAVLPPY